MARRHPNIEIVPATPEDFGEIITVQRAAYVTEAQSVGALSTSALTETAQDLEQVSRTGIMILKVLDGSRIVGSGRAEISGNALTISRMSVAPDKRGGGIGYALLLALESLAGPQVQEYLLTTGQNSLRNRDVYEHWGYSVVSVEQVQHGNSLVHMRKPKNE